MITSIYPIKIHVEFPKSKYEYKNPKKTLCERLSTPWVFPKPKPGVFQSYGIDLATS